MKIGKYSWGLGDRFAQQGKAQIAAILKAKDDGIEIEPVWNKSNREHTTVNSNPDEVRIEADNAVKAANWSGQYFVDADHINLGNVDWFINSSDFFTIDVADYIGEKAEEAQIEAFVKKNKKYCGKLQIPGINEPFDVTEALIREIAGKFLFAAIKASAIYQHIATQKGAANFVTEVSMDEVDEAQTPIEMFFILNALADNNIPAQTIAPKFTGRFNKGVDYVGDVQLFAKEFEQDLLVIDYAVKEFGLPGNLKLSIHSGSDKFSIYPVMGQLIKKHNKGIHVKTAGTTWLEEIRGLALAGGEALQLAKDIYLKALEKIDELSAPYATVIDIDRTKLPDKVTIDTWSGEQFAKALLHAPEDPEYNLHFRQLIHVAYKIAAMFGEKYIRLLNKNKDVVGKQVTENLYVRHIKRLFNVS